ncbi:GtrA family protein [Cellulosilyticum lentocellum]|uniref:GtrA family protein n=1 Tax=Cellulosilyticum lentocellum (strain ATCC 49066 / DSM 5427 / NCIMB 11756 / RHM5) TaxID=642492 RepID=F2JLP3_CELLD|nr:GtrA family protein [Cellulosilyticum lentocellum]ADZ83434.1 GtrA family protein [Cellulosilyticum lentocellum DSM 5427]
MKKMNLKLISLFKKNRQFIRFIIVGVSNLTISLVTYYLMLYLGVYYQIANIFGFVFGSLNGYFWNRNWVFKIKQNSIISILKFYSTYLGTWILSTILLWLEIEIIGISEMIAPFINIFITTPLNYVLNKYWTFEKR